MTDNPPVNGTLRDRIAAVVFEHCRDRDDDGDAMPKEWDYKLADAVIAALGLPPTWGKPSFDNSI